MSNSNEATVNNVEKTVEKSAVKKGGSKKKTILIILVILFVLGLLGYRIASNFNTPPVVSEDTPINVKTAVAEMMSIYATSPISGRIQPIEEVIIMPLASGEITRVNVSMGDRVSVGTTLFEIDKTQMATTLNQASEAYNNAKTNYDRMTVLYNEGAVSLQALEQAQAQYVTARESHTAASDAYSNGTVKSPINGYITSLSATVGSLASPGSPAATVADVSELKIETAVSEYLAPGLSVGDPVDIRIATLGDKTYAGTLTAISPAPAAGSLTYPVSISIADDSGEIMAGMFAEISIVSDEKDMALCIPSSSVIVKSGVAVVVSVEDGNIPVYNEVTTGIDNGEYVEITSGLSEGAVIAIEGQQYVKEGVAVNIVE